MRRKTIDVITLGCSKNLVDSERLMYLLESQGFDVTHDASNPRGQIAVVNTCGFIGDAKEESVNMILELAQKKASGKLEQLYVMGCLSERYRRELEEEIPEVDRFYGKFDWVRLATDLGHRNAPHDGTERRLTTPSHYAYVKISEGCDRHCAYCAIPIITGRHVSRPMEEVLGEVRRLARSGVREFQVIAQELTYYGLDLYHRQAIAELVDRMADIEGVEWIRLHYAYPVSFPMDLLEVMNRRPNVCRYLDIALQHISTPVLRAMHRHIDRDQTLSLIAAIRERVPGIHLRTTLMVGFPGEREEDFEELLDFVRTTRFERMGAFAYCQEDGTPAALLEDSVPFEVKQQRLDRLMELQRGISEEINRSKVGQVLRVIHDRTQGGYHVCRSQYDSPEVDCEVLVPSRGQRMRRGGFYQVRILSATEYDLVGELTDDRPGL